MKHIYLLLVGTLLLTSCVKKVDGTFEAKKDLTLYGRRGDVNLATGNYPAELKLKSKKENHSRCQKRWQKKQKSTLRYQEDLIFHEITEKLD